MSYSLGRTGPFYSSLSAAAQETITVSELKSAVDRQAQLVEQFEKLPSVREMLSREPSFSESAFRAAMGTMYSVVQAVSRGAQELGVAVPMPSDEARALVKGTLAKTKANVRQVKAFTESEARSSAELRDLHGRLLLATNKMLMELQRFVREASPPNSGASGLGFFFALPLILIQVGVLVGLWNAIFESDEEIRKEVNRRCREYREATGKPCKPEDVERWIEAYGGRSPIDQFIETGGEIVMAKAPDASDITKGAGTGIKWGIIIASVGVLGALAYMAWPYMAGTRQVGERLTGEE